MMYISVARVCPHVGHGGARRRACENSLDWAERRARGADLGQGRRASVVISSLSISTSPHLPKSD